MFEVDILLISWLELFGVEPEYPRPRLKNWETLGGPKTAQKGKQKTFFKLFIFTV